MPPVVPRIVNSVSYVTRISHDSIMTVILRGRRSIEVSLFVAGAVFGEIWNDSRSAKCCIFQYKMLVVGVKSNLGCEAGCGGRFPARIILGSAPHWK